MLAELIRFLSEHPLLLVVAVFLAAAIEYIFPPFWGDTLMLAGCFVAGLERSLLPYVFAAALLGSILGSIAAWWLGRAFGAASLRVLGRSPRARRVAARAERLYAHHGRRVLAVNRFLPGVRAFFLPMAGVGNMPLRQVLIWSTVSNVLYCVLLVSVGAFVASRTPDFAVMQSHVQSALVFGALGAVGVLGILTTRHYLKSRVAPAP